MPYRDDSEAMQERYASLTKALDDVRAESIVLAAREAELAREVDSLRARLGDRTTPEPPDDLRRRRARALVATVFGAGACAIMSMTAIARVMTSEISPIDVRTPAAAAGFVWVSGPEGTRLYEGDQFLGTAPLMFPMPEGTHVLRAVQPKTGKQVVAVQQVHERTVVTYRADFSAK